jgi:peptidoglycan/LPS O-acetylase OafA/YrhL
LALGPQPTLLEWNGRRRLGNVPALDGLRGVAIVAVLGFHVVGHHFIGGWIGVHVFFVLSGFLITTLLLEEVGRSGRISLRSFYARRIVRLAPALFAMIAVFVAVILIWSHGPNRHEQLHSAWVAMTYRANLSGGATIASRQDLAFTWTLALEEQFYLLWPLVLILAARRHVSPRVLMAGTLTVALLVVGWRFGLVIDPHGPGINYLYFRPDTTADSLLFGCAAGEAYVFGYLPAPRLLRAAPPVAAVIFAIILLGVSPYHRWAYGLPLPALTITVAATILAIVTGEADTVARWLSHPVARFVGRISYSLYLWNSLVDQAIRRNLNAPQVVRDPFILATSVVFALASYFGLERPLVSLRRRLSAPARAPA